MDNETERGEASMIIELRDGNIIVKHGENGRILLVKRGVVEGSWSKIWETLKAIKEINK